MNHELKIETYRSSTGRHYRIIQNGTITVRKILEEAEVDLRKDIEPVVGIQPRPGELVRFREPIPTDLIFRTKFLDRKRQGDLACAS
jgi:hypothetical protein